MSLEHTFYSNRVLMSFDRNLYPFRFLIGTRGMGKTYSSQNMLCNLYHRIKHLPEDPNNIDDLFIWIRLTDRALENMVENILDSKLQKKHNIVPTMTSKGPYYEIRFNGRLVGHAMSLQNAPVYKGGVWNWQRYRYVIVDEFQREKKERRTFDVVHNLRSLLESVTRFTTRLTEGYDFPTILLMGNTVDEAVDLLYQFDFLPMKFGLYKLKSKHAIIEFAEDSKAYQETQKRNPLRVLQTGEDFTFGERKLTVRDDIVDYRRTGYKRYLGHLQVTAYIKFEMWIAQNNYLYISKGLATKKFENKTYTLHRLGANKGTVYSPKIHQLVRKYYFNNNVKFDKRITAQIFNNNLV